MPDHPTPGEIAYEAWADAMAAHAPWGQPRFAALTPAPDAQRAWEAAAQAVRVATQAETLLYRYRLGQHVRWSGEPEAVWRITYRAAHEDRAEGLRLFYGIKDERSTLIRMAEEYELSIEEPPHA